MSGYVRVSVDIVAYYSGNTYYEEIYLPAGIYEENENEIPSTMTISELDGKHSASTGDVKVEFVSEIELEGIVFENCNDGERLLCEVEEIVYPFDLEGFQTELRQKGKVKELIIKIHKDDEDKVMNLIKEFIVGG